MGDRTASERGMRELLFWLVVCISVLLDQATKAAVRTVVALGERLVLIPHVMDLTHVENIGAAFSMGEGAAPLFVLIALLVLVLACVLVWREDLPMALVASAACVAGGGMGNMIDRLWQGSVTDFLATSFISFPVFNVADIFVTLGIAVSIVLWWSWDGHREGKPTH